MNTIDLNTEMIRSLRLAKNLTIRELAEKVGVSHVMITGYENGKVTPRPKVLQRLADVFGVSKSALTNTTTDPNPDLDNENDLLKFEKLYHDCKSLDPETFQGLVIIMEKLVDRQRTIDFVVNKNNSDAGSV